MATVDLTIPISQLELDLSPPSTGGWHAYLAGRGIAVVSDDVGRDAIARSDARRLLAERRESEVRARELTARNDQMIELKRQTIPTGIPAELVGYAENPGRAVMLADMQAEKDSRPRRRTVVEDALDGGGIVFHPIRPELEVG